MMGTDDVPNTPNPHAGLGWQDDDTLLTALAAALRPGVDLIDEVTAQGRGVYAWRTVDDDLLLAELSFDSREQQISGVRSAAEITRAPSESGDDPSRVLVFEATPLTVELEVQADRVVGQIVPAGPGQVFVETDAVTIQVEADELGFFVLPGVPTGPIRLRCDTENSRVRTGWFRL
jgi:hypothetical protein